jgi:hypothetical protein
MPSCAGIKKLRDLTIRVILLVQNYGGSDDIVPRVSISLLVLLEEPYVCECWWNQE